MQVLWRQMGLWSGTATAVAYAGCCLYMFARQQKLLYQPNHQPDKQHNGIYQYPFSCLKGWVDDEGYQDAVLYFGGSSEPVQLRRENLKPLGLTKYFLPYRGFWPNHDFKPTEKIIKQDALDLFDYAQSNHRHVYVLGRSLGTSMAIHVAAKRPVRALSLITPFDSILNLAKNKYRIFPVQKILKDWHEAHKDAPEVCTPTRVFLAENDKVTPHTSWNMLKDRLCCPLISSIVPKTDHTNIVQQHQLWNELDIFFKQNS